MTMTVIITLLARIGIPVTIGYLLLKVAEKVVEVQASISIPTLVN